MDNLKTINNSITKEKKPNKVIESINKLQSFKELVTPEQFNETSLKKFNIYVKNIQDKNLKIEKNDNGEYKVTMINYSRNDLQNKKDLEKSLLAALQMDSHPNHSIDKINNYISKDLEVVKYNFNETELFNGFLPITQNSFTDYNRNSIHYNDGTKEIENIANQLKRELYLEKGYIEDKNLVLPEQTSVEIGPINTFNGALKDFILEHDISAVEYDKKEIEADILKTGSNIEGSQERIKNLITDNSLEEKEKIQKLKDEYGIGGSTLNLKKDFDGKKDYSPGLGIMYSLNNGQVFPFTWKKVFEIYNAEYNKETTEVKVEQKPIKAEIFDSREKKIGDIKGDKVEAVKKDPKVDIDLELDFKETLDFKDPVRLELKTKAKFGLIENNIMGNFVLEKQPNADKLKSFELNQLDEVRQLINNNELFKAKTPALKVVYEMYNLEDIDDKDGYKGEFSKIFNTTSNPYIRGQFQFRIDKIVKRMNEYDNPVQTLEDYFHSVRTKDFDFTTMDLAKFKKVVSGISVIYNHDLLNSSKNEVKEVVKNINKFMRSAKDHVKTNGIDVREIDSVLASGFLKNYKAAIQ